MFSALGSLLPSLGSAVLPALGGLVSSFAPQVGKMFGGLFGNQGSQMGQQLGSSIGNAINKFSGNSSSFNPSQAINNFGSTIGNTLQGLIPQQYQNMSFGQMGQNLGNYGANAINNYLGPYAQQSGLGQSMMNTLGNIGSTGANYLLNKFGGNNAPSMQNMMQMTPGGVAQGIGQMGSHYMNQGMQNYFPNMMNSAPQMQQFPQGGAMMGGGSEGSSFGMPYGGGVSTPYNYAGMRPPRTLNMRDAVERMPMQQMGGATSGFSY